MRAAGRGQLGFDRWRGHGTPARSTTVVTGRAKTSV